MKPDDASRPLPSSSSPSPGIASLAAVSFAKRKARAAFAVCAIGLALALLRPSPCPCPMMPRRIGGLLSMDGLSFLGTTIILVVGPGDRPRLPALSRAEGGRAGRILRPPPLRHPRRLGPGGELEHRDPLPRAWSSSRSRSTPSSPIAASGRRGAKAAFTYLILASVASAFLFFGMALAYYQTGSLELSGYLCAAADGSGGPLMIAALAMMGVGFAFKLAVAPFPHVGARGLRRRERARGRPHRDALRRRRWLYPSSGFSPRPFSRLRAAKALPPSSGSSPSSRAPR